MIVKWRVEKIYWEATAITPPNYKLVLEAKGDLLEVEWYSKQLEKITMDNMVGGDGNERKTI